jgi:hypothetical protein
MIKEPIQPEYQEVMNVLARGIDQALNPDGHRTVGFFLTVFEMSDADEAAPAAGRFNYISNAVKLDVLAMLKEITARIEGRLFEGGRA